MNLDRLWDDVSQGAQRWLAAMACPAMPLGHFRFSAHAYHPWTLYASNAALAVYDALGLLPQLTAGQRQAWARVFLDHYRPDLGLFLCPQLCGSEFRGDARNYDDVRL